jgi:hypothetical protein
MIIVASTNSHVERTLMTSKVHDQKFPFDSMMQFFFKHPQKTTFSLFIYKGPGEAGGGGDIV